MKLAIFKVNQLGDNVVFLPIVQTLRRLRPEWKLFVFTSPVAAELFSADLPPTQMLAMPTREFNGAWKHPLTLLRLSARARRENFDASLLANDQGNVAHFLARLAGGKVRVGAQPDFIKVSGGVTKIIALPPELKIAQANRELARALVRRIGGDVPWPETPPSPDLSHLAAGASPREGRIVIHPGASLAYKRWPPERFAALANRLAEKFEVLWIEQPELPAPDLTRAVTRVTPATLASFVRTMRTATLFIGNNSGPMNIASALGCPSVIISGPSHPVWDPMWFPERCLIFRDEALACLPCDSPERPVLTCQNAAAPMACMARWTVDEVHRRSVEWIERWRDLSSAAGRER